MTDESRVFDDQEAEGAPDPDETPIRERRLVTQPYDLGITALLAQISAGTLHIRRSSQRPKFQRRIVWSDRLASRLIESILLSVPIPACYLAQDDEFELDVIDGQQRIYAIHRFVENELLLCDLEVMKELNGRRYKDLSISLQRKLQTYTLRCIIITNDSHPEIRFDVFERLNTNTIPLNAQELRNCIERGSLMDMLSRLAEDSTWLKIMNWKEPDARMVGEELILRFFAFWLKGIASYKTPQKHWLNDMAHEGRKYDDVRIAELENIWRSTLRRCLLVFQPNECFRRLPLKRTRTAVNRALMDLTMVTMAQLTDEQACRFAPALRIRYEALLTDPVFLDLTTRAVDHKSRTKQRFELWSERVTSELRE
jgi:hypothetical protein